MGAAVLGVASAGLNIGGKIVEARAKERALEAQKKEAEINAGLADKAADDALVRGSHEAEKLALKTGQIVGAEKTAVGGSGLTVAGAQGYFATTEAMSQIDQATIRNNAARESWGYKQKAGQFRRQEGYLNDAEGQIPLETAFGVGSSLLSIGSASGFGDGGGGSSGG